MNSSPQPPKGPHAFLGAPKLTRSVPAAAPARVVQVEAARPVKPALLTVDPKGRAYLSLQLCDVLGRLPKDTRLELFPPTTRNGHLWRLELRPGVSAYPVLSFPFGSLPLFNSRSVLSPRHFRIASQPGRLYRRIALELQSPTPDNQGFYLLRPNHAYSLPS
ncbi:hypothetical protein LJY25_14705 [Hymenobacter sp. BT175]|uniref:hypothetical protein n=1 Tax=Hymenobacter translucens TaxID=2886507 RepID=UPI001D0DF839|nr:hypothetical protein [Hymenobacter translucens]MCC2547703.1 hypothetical protein [Hymenobacter translucens]